MLREWAEGLGNHALVVPLYTILVSIEGQKECTLRLPLYSCTLPHNAHLIHIQKGEPPYIIENRETSWNLSWHQNKEKKHMHANVQSQHKISITIHKTCVISNNQTTLTNSTDTRFKEYQFQVGNKLPKARIISSTSFENSKGYEHMGMLCHFTMFHTSHTHSQSQNQARNNTPTTKKEVNMELGTRFR